MYPTQDLRRIQDLCTASPAPPPPPAAAASLARTQHRTMRTQHLRRAFPEWRPRDFFHFEVLHRSKRSQARVGVLHTPHGRVDTPGFVAVGTNASVKFVDRRQADAAGMQLMFCNTYHLLVHPGADVIRDAGGLHSFMNRPDRPLITDSGGFQVLSLSQRFLDKGQPLMPGGPQEGTECAEEADGPAEAGSRAGRVQQAPGRELKSGRHAAARTKYATGAAAGAPMVRVSDEGVLLRSYRDGSPIMLTPESSVDAQKAFGADIIIPLDELPAHGTSRGELEAALGRTHAWEERSLARHLEDVRQQAMYAVVHGGTDRQLRRASATHLRSLPFDGFAVGGSLGRDRDEMVGMLSHLMPLLPPERPTHLLGIADDLSVPACVGFGVDTFDSCWPTRLGRHGTLLTRGGRVKISRAEHRNDYGPIDAACDGYVSTNYSRAYLHHLWKAHEPLVHSLLTLHNIKFMADMCAQLRERILQDEI